MVSSYWKQLLLASFCMTLVAGTNGTLALLVKPVLDDIFISQNRDMLLLIPGIAIFVFFISFQGACAPVSKSSLDIPLYYVH